MRITLHSCEKRRVAVFGLAAGERYKVQMVTLGFCGKEEGFADFMPAGCPVYLGLSKGKRCAVNPMVLQGPGTFEFVPDGIVSPDVKFDVSESYNCD